MAGFKCYNTLKQILAEKRANLLCARTCLDALKLSDIP